METRREQLIAELTKMGVEFDDKIADQFLEQILKEAMRPQCGNCFFGKKPEKSSYAEPNVECRRFPPRQAGTQAKSDPFPFPLVLETHWCGEHKPEGEIWKKEY